MIDYVEEYCSNDKMSLSGSPKVNYPLYMIVQDYIDFIARKKRYDSAIHCICYYHSPIEAYRKDAVAMSNWVSYVWQYWNEKVSALVKVGKQELSTINKVIREIDANTPDIDDCFFIPNHEITTIPHTVREYATEKWRKIKEERDKAEVSGCPYLDGYIDSDEISAIRINSAAQIALSALMNQSEFSIEWTMKDNTSKTMTAAEVIGMVIALGNHSNTLHCRARELRDAIFEIVDNYENNKLSKDEALSAIDEIKWE